MLSIDWNYILQYIRRNQATYVSILVPPCRFFGKLGCASPGQEELHSLIILLTLNPRAIPAPKLSTYGTSSEYSPLFPLLAHFQVNMLSVNICSALWHCLPMTGVQGETFSIVLFYILILQFILLSICRALGIKTKLRILNFLQESSFLCFPYNFRLIAILQNLPVYSPCAILGFAYINLISVNGAGKDVHKSPHREMK